MKTQKHTQRWKQTHTHTNENKHICTCREIKTRKDEGEKTKMKTQKHIQRWKQVHTHTNENKHICTCRKIKTRKDEGGKTKMKTQKHIQRWKQAHMHAHKDENTHTQRWKHTKKHTMGGNTNMNTCTLITAGLQWQTLDTLTTIEIHVKTNHLDQCAASGTEGVLHNTSIHTQKNSHKHKISLDPHISRGIKRTTGVVIIVWTTVSKTNWFIEENGSSLQKPSYKVLK